MNPSDSAASLLVLMLAAITLGYLAVCTAVPWTRCRKCRGTGRRLNRDGRASRAWCRRCHGTGLRVRAGRRLWNWLNREYREGHR